MHNVIIARNDCSDLGSFGQVWINGEYFCKSCELPWLDNEQNVSCIPTGEYLCDYNYSNAFKKRLFQILDVPDRTGIRLHSGNVIADTEGCPLFGLRLGFLEGKKAVLSSRSAMDKFMAKVGTEKFKLTIMEV